MVIKFDTCFFRRGIFSFFLILFSSLTHANESSHGGIEKSMGIVVTERASRLPSLIQEGRENNLEIKIEEYKLEAAKARLKRSLSLEKPRFDIERMYAPYGKNIVTEAEEKNWSLSQTIPFPSTLMIRKKIAEQDVAFYEKNLEAKKNATTSEIKKTFFMLLLNHHHLRTTEEVELMVRQFAKLVEAKYISGNGNQGDVLRAQVEISKILKMKLQMDEELRSSEIMLNSLLNRPQENAIPMPEEMPIPLISISMKEALVISKDYRPEIAQAQIAREKSEAMVGLARSDYFPEFMFQYRERKMKEGERSHDLMTGITLPLWFQKIQSDVREAEAESSAQQIELEWLKNSTESELRRMYLKMERARHLEELFRTSVLPQVRQTIRVSEAAYKSDKGTFMEFLDAERMLLELSLEYTQYLSEFYTYQSELERLIGRELEKGEVR